ncbi:MAG: hypothetical protein ACOYI4_08605 [Christensenellales bacterium]|jgi:hypothetical protein
MAHSISKNSFELLKETNERQIGMGRTSKERKIHIIYNFIGVFDFEAAIS